MIAACLAIVIMMSLGMQLLRSKAYSVIMENNLLQQQTILENGMRAFERQIENFRAVETSMLHQDEYQAGKLVKKEALAPRHYYTFTQIRRLFNKHCAELLLSDECFIYFRTSGAVVQNTGWTFDAEAFFDRIVVEDGAEESTLSRVHALAIPQQALLKVSVEASGQTEEKLLFLYRRQSSSVVYGMFLSDAVLCELFNLQNYPANTRLTLSTSEGLLYQSAFEGAQDSQTLECTLDSLYLTAQLSIPREYFSDLTQPIRSLFSVYIIVTLSVALLLSLLFSIGLTRPLQKLVRILPDAHAPEEHVRNELYLLSQGIRSTGQENQQLRLEMARSRAALQQNLLARLVVQDGLSSGDQLQIREYLNDLPRSMRLLCLRLLCEEGRAIDDQEAYLLSQLLAEADFGHSYTLQLNSDLFLLLLEDSADFSQRVSEALCALTSQLRPSALTLEAGASEPVTAEHLHEGYLHAQYALCRFAPPVSLFEPSCEARSMRYADLGAFRKAVLECDEAEALRLLELFRQLRRQYAWLSGALSFLLDSIAAEMNLDGAHLAAISGLGAKTAAVISALQAQKARYAHTLTQVILDYMHEHLSDSLLSMEGIARQFNISKSYLYQLFKNSVGMTPGDKLEQLRMTQAQSLLLTTELSVRDIAAACGYNSSNTFHKAYKKYYGCTPGAARGCDQPEEA